MNTINTYDFNHRPGIKIDSPYDRLWKGWSAISRQLVQRIESTGKPDPCIVIECYQGVDIAPFLENLDNDLDHAHFISTERIFKDESTIRDLTQTDVTDHRIFGKMSSLTIDDFLDQQKVDDTLSRLQKVSILRH